MTGTAVQLGICSFSFHHDLEQGRRDVFDYIDLCSKLGCTQLDLWNAHLTSTNDANQISHASRDPSSADLPPCDEIFLKRVIDAAQAIELPFGCLAVDGAWVYDNNIRRMADHRVRCLRWIDLAARLGCQQVRIDCGGPADMPLLVLGEIITGYRELISHAQRSKIHVLVENHWGWSGPIGLATVQTFFRGRFGLKSSPVKWKF